MDLELGDSTYAVTTGGYESAIPTECIYELEDADVTTYSRVGSFSSDEMDFASIFTDSFCLDSPMFAVQFGRSSPNVGDISYQALGKGVPSLRNAISNIPELSNTIEDELDIADEYSTHRPLIRAHSKLEDGSVLYAEIYYHSFETDSVKHFQLNTFHPDQPFGTGRYEGIFQKSPVSIPPYTEEVDNTTQSDFDFVGYKPDQVEETSAIRQSVVNIGCIENPLKVHGLSLDAPWDGFNSPHHFFPELYSRPEEYDAARITSARAVAVDQVEPPFYQMELDG